MCVCVCVYILLVFPVQSFLQSWEKYFGLYQNSKFYLTKIVQQSLIEGKSSYKRHKEKSRWNEFWRENKSFSNC